MTRWLDRLEINSAVLFGIAAKLWSMATGPITLLLIASHFSLVVQGYYYTFSSLLALQVFVELGMGTVIVQFASHEWAHLSMSEGGEAVGSTEALSRLGSLAKVAMCWFSTGGILLAGGLILMGQYFFRDESPSNVAWVWPWITLCIVTASNLMLLPAWALLEGCNQVQQVYRFRFVNSVLVTLTTWAAVLFDAQLWTAPAAAITGMIWSMVFLTGRYRRFLLQVLRQPDGPGISWRDEIWPMQWKIALSWLSGYLAFSLFTPVLFHFHGPAAAGQFGMTWNLVMAVAAVSSTWVNTRAPQFGVLIAHGNYSELDELFFRLTRISIGLALCGATVLWIVVYQLNVWEHPLATRLLSPLPTGMLMLATVLLQVTTPQSVYLRAHKREPFLIPSVIFGTLIALSTYHLGRDYGAMGMAAGYLALQMIAVPMLTAIWSHCRRKWHPEESAPHPG